MALFGFPQGACLATGEVIRNSSMKGRKKGGEVFMGEEGIKQITSLLKENLMWTHNSNCQ